MKKMLMASSLFFICMLQAGKDKDLQSNGHEWATPQVNSQVPSINIKCPHIGCNSVFGTTNYIKYFWIIRCSACQKKIELDTRFSLDRIRIAAIE